MTGGIFRVENDKKSMGKLILEWIESHKNDPETDYDCAMRKIHRRPQKPEDKK